jgi:hypothetical protein
MRPQGKEANPGQGREVKREVPLLQEVMSPMKPEKPQESEDRRAS